MYAVELFQRGEKNKQILDGSFIKLALHKFYKRCSSLFLQYFQHIFAPDIIVLRSKRTLLGTSTKRSRRKERQSLIYGFIFFRQFGNDLISLSWGGKIILRAFRADFHLIKKTQKYLKPPPFPHIKKYVHLSSTMDYCANNFCNNQFPGYKKTPKLHKKNTLITKMHERPVKCYIDGAQFCKDCIK